MRLPSGQEVKVRVGNLEKLRRPNDEEASRSAGTPLARVYRLDAVLQSAFRAMMCGDSALTANASYRGLLETAGGQLQKVLFDCAVQLGVEATRFPPDLESQAELLMLEQMIDFVGKPEDPKLSLVDLPKRLKDQSERGSFSLMGLPRNPYGFTTATQMTNVLAHVRTVWTAEQCSPRHQTHF